MTQKKKERNYKKNKNTDKKKKIEIELTRHQRCSGNSAKYAIATTI